MLSELELFDAYRVFRRAIDGDPMIGTGPIMTEADLLQGITDALELAGWRWTHIRRSDGVTMGDPGLPDIIAAHPTRATPMLAWELKTAKGTASYEQVAWIHALKGPGIDARLIRPSDYDEALAIILGMDGHP